MKEYNIVNVDVNNVEKLGFFCVKNKKHPGYIAKLSWLRKRFEEGLCIKLILTNNGTQAGYLEYIPGEYTWRIVEAAGYYVIHCVWVNSKNLPYKGLARALLEECVKDAELNNKEGVAVVTSDGSWMANKTIFIKNGFNEIDQADPHFQLLINRIGNGPLPCFFKDIDERRKLYQGLQLLYTNQCPYIGKAINELPPVSKMYGIKLNLIELNNSAEARQKMLSPYGMFNLVYNGKLLSDHPISATRFKNILEKDLNLKLSISN